MGAEVSSACCQPEMLDDAMKQKDRYEQFKRKNILVTRHSDVSTNFRAKTASHS